MRQRQSLTRELLDGIDAPSIVFWDAGASLSDNYRAKGSALGKIRVNKKKIRVLAAQCSLELRLPSSELNVEKSHLGLGISP